MSSGSYGEVPGLETLGPSATATAVICGLGLFAVFIWSMAILGVLYCLSLIG